MDAVLGDDNELLIEASSDVEGRTANRLNVPLQTSANVNEHKETLELIHVY